MKKLFCTALSLLICTYSFGQLYPRNIVSVRGGVNISSMSQVRDGKQVDKGLRGPKVGWHFGAIDEILLTSSMPLYIDVGLMMSNKGVRYVEKSNVTVSGVEASQKQLLQYGATYLQVPVAVSYHVYLGNFTLQPYAGLHYDLGLWGRAVDRTKIRSDVNKDVNKTTKNVQNVYKSNLMKRSDFGLVVGLGATYMERYYFGISWEDGFCDISKIDAVHLNNMSNLRITVGYNF